MKPPMSSTLFNSLIHNRPNGWLAPPWPFTFTENWGSCPAMIALFDIGNTHTHIGLANSARVSRHLDMPTKGWGTGAAQRTAVGFLNKQSLAGVALCSVV